MRALALWLLGLWTGLLVASAVMATRNFRTVDRVLGPGSPEVAERLAPVPPTERRAVLRHMASEINRWMFRWWSAAQVALALGVLAAVWGAGSLARALAAVALLLTLFQAGLLAPALASLGRPQDFVPRPLPPEIGRRFGLLHAAYTLSDLVKLLLLAVLGFAVGRRG